MIPITAHHLQPVITTFNLQSSFLSSHLSVLTIEVYLSSTFSSSSEATQADRVAHRRRHQNELQK